MDNGFFFKNFFLVFKIARLTRLKIHLTHQQNYTSSQWTNSTLNVAKFRYTNFPSEKKSSYINTNHFNFIKTFIRHLNGIPKMTRRPNKGTKIVCTVVECYGIPKIEKAIFNHLDHLLFSCSHYAVSEKLSLKRQNFHDFIRND
jgi:hypothetical protein